jgi:hypothetical protein
MKFVGTILLVIVIILTITGIYPSAQKATEPRLQVSGLRQRLPARDLSFWNSAEVAEPEIFREASSLIMQETRPIPVDHVAQITQAIKTGDLGSLNSKVAAWFDADPVATRDWLATAHSLESLQPALLMIAAKISQGNDPENALAWAENLSDHETHEQMVFDIYTIASRNHQFTVDQLRAAPLPAHLISELLSGTAGD